MIRCWMARIAIPFLREGFAVRAIRVVLRRGAILGGLACPKAIKVEGTVEADEARA